jgi:hypothetical protein
LWVVCRHCERWNLSPLEERWEAVEQRQAAVPRRQAAGLLYQHRASAFKASLSFHSYSQLE